METAEIKEPERCYGCGRAVSCRWCNNCAQPANSPSIDRIRELEQEVERLKKLADDFRAWPPRLCDRCKKVAIGFPFDGSSTADPGYHHGEQRLCEGCYYDPELATPAQPAKPETGKANIPVHPGSFAAKVAHELGVIVDEWSENPTKEQILSRVRTLMTEYGRMLAIQPAPSPHVETEGQERGRGPWVASTANSKCYQLGEYCLVMRDDGATKNQAEYAARDLAAMAAVRKYGLIVHRWFNDSGYVARRDRKRLHYATSETMADPADAILALASQLSASQADQQDGKERA